MAGNLHCHCSFVSRLPRSGSSLFKPSVIEFAFDWRGAFLSAELPWNIY